MSRVAELAAVLERAGIGPDFDPAQLSSALERARVVGVLDSWAERSSGKNGRACWENQRVQGAHECRLFRSSVRDGVFAGATPDAARAAAAKAIESGEV